MLFSNINPKSVKRGVEIDIGSVVLHIEQLPASKIKKNSPKTDYEINLDLNGLELGAKSVERRKLLKDLWGGRVSSGHWWLDRSGKRVLSAMVMTIINMSALAIWHWFSGILKRSAAESTFIVSIRLLRIWFEDLKRSFLILLGSFVDLFLRFLFGKPQYWWWRSRVDHIIKHWA